MKTYKQQIIEQTIKGMKKGGWDNPEALTFLLERVYDCGYLECIRNIQDKHVSRYSDQYTDIISDGGIDPR